MKFFASKRYQRVTNLALAAVLSISTITASVPFLFSQTANAAAGYNVNLTKSCVNGLVKLNVTGDNPNSTSVWVKSSANFKFSAPVLAGPDATNVASSIQFDQASIPDGGVTIYYSDSKDGPYQWLNDSTAIASYPAFDCYNNVYVAPVTTIGSDTNQGTTAATPFASIQKALDTVNENGTVNVANGTYDGTAVFRKNGTKLIGATKSGVTLYAQSSSGQAGVFADGINDITLKNFTIRPGSTLTAGSIVKYTNGTKGRIENVDVKASIAANLNGVDINSFSDATLYNIYVNGVGKDGISVTSKYDSSSLNVSNNLNLNYVTTSSTGWSGFAFYTIGGSNPVGESMTGLQLNNIRAQYNLRGIYFEGKPGITTTGVGGAAINLKNASLKNSTKYYIVNTQSNDVNAYSVAFDGKSANQMTSPEFVALGSKIIDRDDYPSLGTVHLRTPLGKPVVQTQGWTNAATTVGWTAATDRIATDLTYEFLYSTDRYTGYTTVNNGKSTSKDVSVLFARPGSYFVKVIATEDGVTTTSDVVEIQVIGSLAITAIDGSNEVGSTATVEWTPVYGREQFSNYEVYIDGEIVETVIDQAASSADIVLPSIAGPVDVYVKVNFKAGIGGSNFRSSTEWLVIVTPAPITPIVPTTPSVPDSTATPATATTAAPATFAAPAFTGPSAVLGAATNPATNSAAIPAVKGATDEKSTGILAAIDTNSNDGTIFGLAWYWWIGILAVLAVIASFIIGAIRRRNADA